MKQFVVFDKNNESDKLLSSFDSLDKCRNYLKSLYHEENIDKEIHDLVGIVVEWNYKRHIIIDTGDENGKKLFLSLLLN